MFLFYRQTNQEEKESSKGNVLESSNFHLRSDVSRLRSVLRSGVLKDRQHLCCLESPGLQSEGRYTSNGVTTAPSSLSLRAHPAPLSPISLPAFLPNGRPSPLPYAAPGSLSTVVVWSPYFCRAGSLEWITENHWTGITCIFPQNSCLPNVIYHL